MQCLTPHEQGVILRVRLQPRASRDEIQGEADGRLRIRVGAPPVEGAANDAVVKLLSKALRLRKSAVRLIRGEKAREKDFLLEGLTADRARTALEAAHH